MLPNSLSKNTITLGRPSFVETDRPDYNEDEINDFFNDNGVILEDEEEYDVLNDETFGQPLGNITDEPDGSEPQPLWEEYDLHNDETFGAEISYDWEDEHDKMVGVLENDSEKLPKQSKPNEEIANGKGRNAVKSEILNRNGYHDTSLNSDKYGYLEYENDLDGAILKKNVILKNRVLDLSTIEDQYMIDSHENALKKELGRTLDSTRSSNEISKTDKWYKGEENESHFDDHFEHNNSTFPQDYSLFSSGSNFMQNVGIHIPPVSNAVPQGQMTAAEYLEKKIEALKLQEKQTQQEQSATSSIPSVADLEKQWINDFSSKSVITADCFRAYNSAFFVNNSNVSSVSNQSVRTPVTSPPKPPMESFMNTELFRSETNTPSGMSFQKMVNSPASFSPQGFPALPPPSVVNGECDPQNIYAKMNATNRLPPSQLTQLDRKSFPAPVMTDSRIVMCDNILFRNAPHFAEMNARQYVNLNRGKVHSGLDPSVIMSSDNLSRPPDPSVLMENNNLSRLGINVFQPPPGLTIDPAKLRHFQTTAAIQSRSHQMTSSLAMQPIQVLNGIATAERQKQMMKFQKEERLSVVDEYAGMMTEREKYWLAGVQLLQINAMDPFKDDYYFTNYQARRKGNRNKNQTTNNNNKKWQNEHTKDYLPLQFENSLGKVQVGSVVAPRKVIDTDVFESSPKHNGKLNGSINDDPIANTSHRKRKAIMLHIENMYGKIIALESLQIMNLKNKTDPAKMKEEFEGIVNSLKEEIQNLKDDFKIIMSIKKGKRLVLKFLMFCDNPEAVWFQIFEILDRIIRGDHEHCMLLSYLPYFRTWLTTTELNVMNRLSDYFKKNLGFHFQDKFSVSVMANMIEQAELIYLYSKEEDQKNWMNFIITLAEHAHQSLENIQKPVVSVKPQTLRSHLLKCEKLENGYMSFLLRIFSNNPRK